MGLEFPVAIALDVAAGKMYWTDVEAASIQRANLGGSQVEILVSMGLLSLPVGIALDVTAGKMYWTEWNTRIQRANLERLPSRNPRRQRSKRRWRRWRRDLCVDFRELVPGIKPAQPENDLSSNFKAESELKFLTVNCQPP